ncbi:hypothetical protein FRD01_07200 [Microvenator marinus]|uniref:Uncharacterized protein n=1 Tax=Microvenator marinus TaxID=2600177 RepID=A0A5B8XUG1_9DELT|nr:hypothetical protein [Microvenator marinus]QED27029.1 hypothetical protein FRD01_07200 [Microvenator marinus]
MNDLYDYASTDLQVVEVGSHEVIVDLGDVRATIGQAIKSEGAIGRVHSFTGSRKARVQVFDTSQWTVGAKVEVLGFPAKLSPLKARSEVRELEWAEHGAALDSRIPGFMEIDPNRGAISLGVAEVDEAVPLVQGGVNLIFDETSDSQIWNALWRRSGNVHRIVAGESLEADVQVVGQDAYERWFAIRAAVAQTAASRDAGKDIALGFELPILEIQHESGPVMEGKPLSRALDDLLESVVSTKSGKVTVFIRVPLKGMGSAFYAESLSFCDADTRLWVAPDGTVDITRSHSKLGDGSQVLALLNRAELARERRSLLGDIELTDEERTTIARADELDFSLATLLDSQHPEN